VDELKNAIQLAVIWATGVPVPVGGLTGEEPAEALAEPLTAGADDDVAAGAVVDKELPLLEQAVAVSAATMTPAIARPFAGWNLIARLRKSRLDVPAAAGLLALIVFPADATLLRPTG
jgi:hypothetical protein